MGNLQFHKMNFMECKLFVPFHGINHLFYRIDFSFNGNTILFNGMKTAILLKTKDILLMMVVSSSLQPKFYYLCVLGKNFTYFHTMEFVVSNSNSMA